MSVQEQSRSAASMHDYTTKLTCQELADLCHAVGIDNSDYDTTIQFAEPKLASVVPSWAGAYCINSTTHEVRMSHRLADLLGHPFHFQPKEWTRSMLERLLALFATFDKSCILLVDVPAALQFIEAVASNHKNALSHLFRVRFGC